MLKTIICFTSIEIKLIFVVVAVRRRNWTMIKLFESVTTLLCYVNFLFLSRHLNTSYECG